MTGEVIGIGPDAQARWPEKAWHSARARGALLGVVIRRQPVDLGTGRYVINATGQWFATLSALEDWITEREGASRG